MTAIEIPVLNFMALLPLLIVTVTGLLVVLLDVFVNDKPTLGWISLIGVVLAAIVGVMQQGIPNFDPAFQRMALVDAYANFFNLIFLITAALSVLVSLAYLSRLGLQKGEYYALLLFATAGMMAMAMATDLMLIFLGLETMSIALYVMAALNRNMKSSGEAGLKYFLMGSFASSFLLYGMALVYGAAGSTNLYDIGDVLAAGSAAPMALLGLGLMVVGFAFKVSAVPFQWWTPDVYHGAPTSVTTFMSVGAKAAGFAAFMRVLMISFPAYIADWQMAIAILAVLTMTLGNIAALAQKDVKRMLAYSGIAHAGYLLVGVAAGTAEGVSSVLYYLMVYTFMNIGAFAVISVLEHKGAIGTKLEEYVGLSKRNPWLAAAMTIFLFSLTGFPPLAGFWGKFYLFRAAVNADLTWLSIIAVLNSGIAAFYYLNVVVQMYMKSSDEESADVAVGLSPQIALIVSGVATVLLGIIPASVINMALKSIMQ